jgi:hypothetical protein
MANKPYLWTVTKPDGTTVSGESISVSAANSQISWHSQLCSVPRMDKSKAAQKARAENKDFAAACTSSIVKNS